MVREESKVKQDLLGRDYQEPRQLKFWNRVPDTPARSVEQPQEQPQNRDTRYLFAPNYTPARQERLPFS